LAGRIRLPISVTFADATSFAFMLRLPVREAQRFDATSPRLGPFTFGPGVRWRVSWMRVVPLLSARVMEEVGSLAAPTR